MQKKLLAILLALVAATASSAQPLVRNLSRPYEATKGLEGKHIAMWGSHGLYYELANARWEWQRARTMQAVEDKFPTSYVLQYIAPMLENAGATVLMPRERDANPHEVIVDNDGGLASSAYSETKGKHNWHTGKEKGFAWDRDTYHQGVNPFEQGTYRQVDAVTDSTKESHAVWTPAVPVERPYAVYVSYHSLPKSAPDVHYTIHHKGGATTYSVNQRMGGGTWVYLGTFTFDRSSQCRIEVSNLSATSGAIVTADAVRLGGGMGNVARQADGKRVYDNTKIKKTKATSRLRTLDEPHLNIPAETSGAPRYIEAARYYLQWAGMPESVYSPSQGTNDYTDDYRCRGLWVNYLAGGSRSLPKGKGLGVPVDLSFGFHTDGDSKPGDELIGTLSIYTTKSNNGRLGDGTSRTACKRLSDEVYNSIMRDITQQMEPSWRGRKSVDRNYNESSTPQVPAMLLELLSHENFADMRWGLDPRFKFVVSRAIYKGILRFMAQRCHTDYVVQPLPVSHMALQLTPHGEARLTWRPVMDAHEPTATPEHYIVYQRIGDGDFDNGTLVSDTVYTCSVPKGTVVSFRVTALNAGGQSMPSETLSMGISEADSRPVLVINGFTRISAPDDFVTSDDRQAGFLAWQDNGVAQGQLLEYAGAQKEYQRSVPWTDDDSPGFGSSTGEYERMVIAGNTFDYPALHGSSILAAGHSFVSVSRDAAALMPDSLMGTYSMIDLILGKQKQTKLGRPGVHPLAFKTFDAEMQQRLIAYCKQGGRVMVSGAYVATDLWHNPLAPTQQTDQDFALNILKYTWRDDKATTSGSVIPQPSPLGIQGLGTLAFHTKPNSESYAVESPDCLVPSHPSAVSIMRYADTGKSAGIAFGGTAAEPWRTVVLGFPFESLCDTNQRNVLMKQIIQYLSN